MLSIMHTLFIITATTLFLNLSLHSSEKVTNNVKSESCIFDIDRLQKELSAKKEMLRKLEERECFFEFPDLHPDLQDLDAVEKEKLETSIHILNKSIRHIMRAQNK